MKNKFIKIYIYLAEINKNMRNEINKFALKYFLCSLIVNSSKNVFSNTTKKS